ncbi:unnamed protein product [Adineta ricciae]|uniref:DJ-1/PfpI domain-containing protein n=1 Tax=Adineta ricciae TaxID=249248 RepID=A0A813MQS3_ADIRI|nr:unnamed protein product [Adineta ricciae]CAF0853151.1 unnamed protein product [Adineta ricciae]
MFGSKKALLLLANGSEESEVVITVDVLRRAGIKVTITSIEANREALKCAQDTVIVPDISINELSTDDKYDVVVVPGGEKGSEAMAKNLAVGNLLQQHYEKGKLVAAICAGPTVFQAHKIGLKNATITAYPECQNDLKTDYNIVDQPVHHCELKTADGERHMITSQGPGTAFAFALKIVEVLDGSSKMTKKALVFIANGSEEIETVTTVDVLRRAEIDVDVVSIEKNGQDALKCSRNVRVLPDKALDDVKTNQYDCVVIPGGNDGSKAMAASTEVGQILTKHYEDGKVVAAICAGPRALLAHKIGVNHKHTITCYPSVRKEFTDGEPYKLEAPDQVVCHSKQTAAGAEGKEYHIVTSQGPATTMAFALKLIELLKGKDEATKVKEGLLA